MPSAQHGPATELDVDGVPVRLTSPDKPVFPGITKREVVEYYLAVGAAMLEQVAGRPTALERWPDGVAEGADHFFQKHLPAKAPGYLHSIGVEFPSGRTGTMLDPDSRAALAWAAQMGAITFHAWPVTRADVAHPDQLRIDLDPSPATSFDDARRVALTCHALFEEWGWPSYVKTSGGRGLHIFVPLRPEHSFIDVRHAAIAVGRELERRDPAGVTTSWWKEERGERVFVDFNQNAQDRLMASAYSLRPRDGAPVSMPIEWGDLPDVDPLAFTLRSVPGLVASRTRDPWGEMAATAVDLGRALDQWEADVAAGLPELPYPPDFKKMPGEPSRVQPSRARPTD